MIRQLLDELREVETELLANVNPLPQLPRPRLFIWINNYVTWPYVDGRKFVYGAVKIDHSFYEYLKEQDSHKTIETILSLSPDDSLYTQIRASIAWCRKRVLGKYKDAEEIRRQRALAHERYEEKIIYDVLSGRKVIKK